MTNPNINWKSSQILKVFGTTIREGTYNGSKPTDSGTITNDNPTTFTPEYIEMLYNNAKSPVPFVLKHKTGHNENIGFAYKFGVNDTKDDLKYEGFNFDEDAIRKITTEGFDFVSPEIVEEKDTSGKVINAYISRIAWVQSPHCPMGAAIDGTQAGMEPIVFSKGTSNDTVDINMTEQTTDEIDQGQSSTGQTAAQKLIDTVMSPPEPRVVTPQPVVHNTLTATSDPSLETMRQELNDYKTKVESLSKHNEKMLTDQYNTMVSEIKTLGVDDPATIVKGLNIDQKIEVLNKLKGTLVKTKPMIAQTDSSTTASNNDSKDAAIDTALASLGYRKADYEKLISNTR